MKKIVGIFTFLFVFLCIACSKNSDFSVTVVYNEKNVKEKKFLLEELKEKNFLELLEENFSVKYDFLNAEKIIEMAGIKVRDQAYFFGIYQNNVFMGSDYKNFKPKKDDKIFIKMTTELSERDLFIDNIIYNFLEKKAKDYLMPFEKIDYMLFQSMSLLKASGSYFEFSDYFSLAEYQEKISEINEEDFIGFNPINTCFKYLTIAKNLGVEITFFSDYLRNADYADLSEYSIPYVYLALEKNFSLDKEKLLEYIPNDPDLVAIYLLALAKCQGKIFEEKIKELTDFSLSLLTKDGIDFYGANSCSTALTLIGLISVGKNPLEVKYENMDIIDLLLKYYQEEGFSYKIGEKTDFLFSTPQVITSLIIYKLYRDSSEIVSLF